MPAAATGFRQPRAVEHRPGCLTDRVGEGFEIIAGTHQDLRRVGVMTDDFPASRSGEPGAVRLAEVIRVRLSVRRQRADHGGRVGVDVGERGHGGQRTRGARTAPDRTHVAGR